MTAIPLPDLIIFVLSFTGMMMGASFVVFYLLRDLTQRLSPLGTAIKKRVISTG